MLTYFVYRHVRLDKNIPFYIGMGKSRDKNLTQVCYYGRAYSKQRNKYWEDIASSSEYRIDIVFESENREIIIEKEKELIDLYGLTHEGGILCNLTYGGEHYELSEEAKKEISKRMMGNKNGLGTIHSESLKKSISDRFKGNTSWIGRKHKEESKLKISQKHKGKIGTTIGMRNLNGTASPIICNGVEYCSISDCVRILFKCNEFTTTTKFRAIKNSIIKVLKGKSSTYKGYTFKYSNHG